MSDTPPVYDPRLIGVSREDTMRDLQQRLHGAIASGVRQVVTDERTAINYHERRASPDLNWVYSQADGIADYVSSSQPWKDLAAVEAVLAAMRDLHQPIPRGESMQTLVCRECRNDWPCDTAWKLDGLDIP